MPIVGSKTNFDQMMLMLKFQLDVATYNALSAYMDGFRELLEHAENRAEALQNLVTGYVDAFDVNEKEEVVTYMKELVNIWKS